MYLLADHDDFPDVELAHEDPNGLLAVGGDLKISRLLSAYSQGIFPWYGSDDPLLWWSPDPRFVLHPAQLKISRSLKKSMRNGNFTVSFDQHFDRVIQACSEPRNGDPRTWIHADMITAYNDMFRLGYAHSVECWHQGELVGGLYGVALDRVFFGESMFSRVSNASKVAFVFTVQHLLLWGYQLIDCQVYTPHLLSLGAVPMPRREFVKNLKTYCVKISPQKAWTPTLSLSKLESEVKDS